MDYLQALNIIQTQYPDALPILQKPGVAQVYFDYLNSQPPWTTAQLQAALRNTPYYQQSPQAVRDWDILQATDPATASQKAEQTKRLIDDLQRQTGVVLDGAGGLNSPAFSFLVDAIKYGWDANEIKYRLLASVNTATYGLGEIGKTAADIANLADQYGVPLSDKAALDQARQVMSGAMDMNGVTGYLLAQAKSLFPALSGALDRGITVRQYVDPYIQIAQQELGINTADVRLTDPKWMQLLNQVDPKTGERVSMSLDQALQTFRSDPAWGYDQTSQGRQSATNLAAQLQQKFGNAA